MASLHGTTSDSENRINRMDKENAALKKRRLRFCGWRFRSTEATSMRMPISSSQMIKSNEADLTDPPPTTTIEAKANGTTKRSKAKSASKKGKKKENRQGREREKRKGIGRRIGPCYGDGDGNGDGDGKREL